VDSAEDPDVHTARSVYGNITNGIVPAIDFDIVELHRCKAVSGIPGSTFRTIKITCQHKISIGIAGNRLELRATSNPVWERSGPLSAIKRRVGLYRDRTKNETKEKYKSGKTYERKESCGVFHTEKIIILKLLQNTVFTLEESGRYHNQKADVLD